MFCAFCGQNIPDEVEFCPFCGKQLKSEESPAPKQEAVKEKKPSVWARILKHDIQSEKYRISFSAKMLSWILGIFVFSLLLAAVVTGGVKMATSESGLNGLFDKKDFFENELEDDDSFMDFLYEEMLSYEKGKVELSREEFAKFFEESTFKEFAAEKISLLLKDVYNGTDKFYVSRSEARRLIRENDELLEDRYGWSMLDFEDDLVDSVVSFANEVDVEDIPSDAASAIRMALSTWSLLAVIASVLLLIFLVFLLYRKRVLSILSYVAAMGILNGAIGVVVYIALTIFGDMVRTELHMPYLLYMLICEVFTKIFILSLIFIGVAVLLLVCRTVLRRKVVDKFSKQAK